MTILIAGGVAHTQAATHQDDRFAPERFGIPGVIAGYAVLAVLTKENSACMAGKNRLVLQSPQSTIDGALRGFPKERSELAQWELIIVGPGITREQLINQLARQNQFFKVRDCMSLQLPSAASCSSTGECKNPPPYQGYTVIQNTSLEFNTCPTGVTSPCPLHGQSVILTAPTVGSEQPGIWSDKQGEAAAVLLKLEMPYRKCSIPNPVSCNHHPGWSALLNNGMTDKGFFLQIGLFFTNKAEIATDGTGTVIPEDLVCNAPAGCFGEGWVVWARAAGPGHALFSPSVGAEATTVPYIPGHEYYTTITYTSGVWWTCAADMADASSYRCQNHPDATGDHLIEHQWGTNVFVEVWNEGNNWAASGFTVQWAAHDAMIYLEGAPGPLPWSSQTAWTLDACPDAWPAATRAVGGSLVPDGRQFNDGWALFNVDGSVPPFCFGP